MRKRSRTEQRYMQRKAELDRLEAEMLANGTSCGCHYECGDMVLNIGPQHWAVCETHKWRWYVGSDLYSGWRYETERQWRENARKLDQYAERPKRAEPTTWFYGSRPTTLIDS